MQANTNTLPPASRLLPWSYSSLQAYETCPRRFYLTRVAKKVREPQTAATAWGNQVHKALENALNGVAPLEVQYKGFQKVIDTLNAAPGQKLAERNFALTAAFKPTDYWAKDAWVRGKADVTILRSNTGTLLDYKTGKPKEDADQLKLFAGVLLAEQPHLKRVHTGYIWLKNDRVDKETFERDDAPGIWQGFSQRVARMLRSEEKNDFPPKPSGLCREWCPVGKTNCEFCGS